MRLTSVSLGFSEDGSDAQATPSGERTAPGGSDATAATRRVRSDVCASREEDAHGRHGGCQWKSPGAGDGTAAGQGGSDE